MNEKPTLMPCYRCNGKKVYNKRPCALCKGLGGVPKSIRTAFTTVCHVADKAFVVDGRVIQRCCVCGFKLFDSRDTPLPVPTTKRPQIDAPWWTPGDLVRVIPGDENKPTRQMMTGHYNTDPLPADFCIEMVE